MECIEKGRKRIKRGGRRHSIKTLYGQYNSLNWIFQAVLTEIYELFTKRHLYSHLNEESRLESAYIIGAALSS